MLDLIDDVQRRFNLAVLFITHDLRVAAQICDRIVVMEKGVVVEEGPTHRVFNAPEHPYTQARCWRPRRAGASGSARRLDRRLLDFGVD